MADVLSALPLEGGARVGWTPVPGTTEYEVRHSLTGAGVWTTVTDITTNYTILTGLDYTEVYDVQRRSTDGIDTNWSASVTVQPWIDPDAEFATIFHESDILAPTDSGDLGASYEDNTWDVFIAFQRIRGGVAQSIFGLNANMGTADGLAGFIVRMNASSNIDAIVVTGASSSVTTTTSSTFLIGTHVLSVGKSGTTVTILDESEGSIGSGTTTSSTMDWTTSTSQRTTMLAHWATTVSPNLTGRMTGNLKRVIYVPGGVTSGERTALLRYLREKYIEAAPTTRREYLLDAENIDSNSVGSPAIIAPTRQGTVLTSLASPSHRSGLGYCDVHRLADGRWRMWATAFKYVTGSVTQWGLLRMDSPDGLAWTEPDLGISGSTGLVKVNVSNDFHVHNVVLTDFAGEEYLYGLEVEIPASDTGAQIYAASDEDDAPTLLCSVDVGAFYNEGKWLAIRDSDQRPIFYFNSGHAANDRTIGWAVREGGGQGADESLNVYQNLGDITAFQAPDADNQFYSISVRQEDSTLWLQFVTRFNETTDLTHFDLYVSRDEGQTASQVEAQWLNPGTSGQWDDAVIYAASLVRLGNEWRLYYTGHDEVHGSGLEGSSIGYATLTYGRVAELIA